LNIDDLVKYGKEIFIDGRYINGAGVEVANPDWAATDFIAFAQNNILWKSYGYLNASVITVVFYDSGYNFLGVIPQAEDVIGMMADSPEGTAYIRMSYSKSIPIVYISTKQNTGERVFENYMDSLGDLSEVFNTDSIVYYDSESFITGGYINQLGTYVANGDWAATDFIPILETDFFYKNFGWQNGSVMSVVFYDVSQNLLYTPTEAQQAAGIYVDIPIGAKYIRMSCGNGGTRKVYIGPKQDVNLRLLIDYDRTLQDPFIAKDILALGDSITAGGGYLVFLDTILSPNSLVNKGVSGRRVHSMIYDRIDISVGSPYLIEPSVLQGFDIITIGGHANNYGNSVPIGLLSDALGVKEIDTLTITGAATSSGNITITLNGIATTVAVTSGDTIANIVTKINAALVYNWAMSGASPNVIFTKRVGMVNSAPTFSGGTTGVTGSFVVTEAGTDKTADSFYAEIKFSLEYLLENAPLSRIIAFGGLQYKGYGYEPWGAANANGVTTKMYEDAWRAGCQFYGIPFIEMYNESGVSDINKDIYYEGDGDYVHPNSGYGMKIIAQLIAGKLKSTIQL
ncbi:MAG: hypothetical protein HQ522_16150, partial [Bacteroidetes bacterium]|nr:hypothetical protein [Bacteroidota bacterium]